MKKEILKFINEVFKLTSDRYGLEEIVDICFIPEYRNSSNGFFIGSNIRATISTGGHTEFLISVGKIKHNAGKQWVEIPQNLLSLYKEANVIFNTYSKYENSMKIRRVEII